jgi:type IV pilus assembly protein PilB
MTVTPELKKIISNRGGAEKIKEQALKEGMNTLHMSATEYVLEGMTSYEEMLRVSFDD